MCFYQRFLFSCGHHHCKIERACKRKNSLDQPCHDKEFKNILEKKICLPCLSKTDAINCTTEDILRGEDNVAGISEGRSAGVESHRECTIDLNGPVSKTRLTPSNTSLRSPPMGSLETADGLDLAEEIGTDQSSWLKTSGTSIETSHPIEQLMAGRPGFNQSKPQDYSQAIDRQTALSAVDDRVSLMSSLSGTPTERPSITLQTVSGKGRIINVDSSSRPVSYTKGSLAQQPTESGIFPITQPSSRASFVQYGDAFCSDSDRYSQRLCDEQLCGVSTNVPYQKSQKAGSRPFLWAHLPGKAVEGFQHAMNQVFRFSASKAVIRWIMSVGLPAIQLREPPLEEGKSRVRWTCRCGRRMYDDYIEKRPGAAKELAECLNGSVTARPSANERKSGDQSTTTATSESSGLMHSTQQSTHLGIQSQRSPSSYDPCPHHRVGGSTTIECDPECRWLLVCARSKASPPILSQLNVCSTGSDVQLYKELKESYSRLKGKWRQLFSLRGVKSIRFVQFELHPANLVDIQKVPSMPPPTARHEYTYQPSDLIPPLGSTLMTHLFHHPEDASESQSIACLRTPKKRKAKLTVCPQQGTSVGWGIHIVEGWVGSMVWALALVLFLSGTLVFAVCWAVLERDLQGAFGAAAYLVALVGLGVGTGQAWFA